MGLQGKQLDEQKALLQAVIYASRVPIVAVNTQGNITTWSPAAERLFGWKESEVLGRPSPLIPRGKHAEYRSLREVALHGATFTGAQVCAQKKDGSCIPVLVSAAPLRDPKGAVQGVVAVIDDVSAGTHTQEPVVRSEEQGRYIADLFRRSLVPASEMVFSTLEVATLCEPALTAPNVGGDFCDAFALNAGKVALLVGDVCGRGLEPAIYGDHLKYAVRAYLRESPYPTQALTRLNRFVCDTQRLDGRGEETFTVLTLGVVDPASGEMVLALAGAEPPLLLRKRSGATKTIPVTPKLPLGIEAGETYGAVTLRLEPGDTLLLTTDGITEARHEHEFLDSAGLLRLFEHASAESPQLGELGQAILDGARTFAGGSLRDDACLLLARRKDVGKAAGEASATGDDARC